MSYEISNCLSNFVDCIQDYIDREGITLNRFSERVGIALSAIIKWNNLEYFPTIESVIKIADYFECSIDYLFGLSERREVTTVPSGGFLEAFEALCNKMGVSHYKVAKECQFGQSMISKWKRGKFPKCETLIKIAGYFECSIDYLIGRKALK